MFGQLTFSDLAPDAVDMALELAGLWLLWRLVLSPAARAKGAPSRLAEWPIGWIGFGVFVGGAILVGVIVIFVLGWFLPRSDEGEYLVLLASYLAMVAWCLGFRELVREGRGFAPTIRPQTALVGGAATFLIAFATIQAVFTVWTAVMQLVGLQPEAQDVVEIFKAIQSPVARVLFVLFASVGAPVVEELVFRGGLYPFALARLPRWGALLVSACLFAAAHGSLTTYAPLVAAGVILSLAYERTGNLAVPIVAHCLINLHAVAWDWFFG